MTLIAIPYRLGGILASSIVMSAMLFPILTNRQKRRIQRNEPMRFLRKQRSIIKIVILYNEKDNPINFDAE